MSAIAGIHHSNQEPINFEEISRMMESFQNFPADDIRVWYKENIFFGCHAQWVTPESICETLPFYDYQRRLSITADAIIDNREELFDQLDVRANERASIPDSKLILLAYDKWGEESPKYLVGDFAFFIWDEKRNRLFGARDFSGSRTLYYTQNSNSFAFSTIIESLLSLPYIKKELNQEWVAEYLAIIGMIDVVDQESTVFKKIKQIPPSHSITVVGEEVRVKQYCKLTAIKKLKLKSNEEYLEAFQEVFDKAVTSRVRTNRLVGAQLSGGLDSGSIVSFAARSLKKKDRQLHTFSYIPPKDFIDFTPHHLMPNETLYMKSTVKHIGGIQDHYLDFQGKDPYSEMDDFLKIMEMPYKFFENSFWLKGMFEKAQDENVGILLNGGRGNLSISWGSAIDYYASLLKRFRWLKLVNELNQYSHRMGGNRFRNLPFITRIAFPIIDRLFPKGESYEFPTLINAEFAKKTKVYDKLREFGINETGWFSETDIFKQRKLHFEDVFHWNASNTIATKLSLRYSLWKRDPTNDLRVIRFCLSLPEDQYVQNGMDRALIRRATKDLLPDKVRLNQKVFGVQGADWVHRMIPKWETFREEVQQLQKDNFTLSFLNKDTIDRAAQKVSGHVKPQYAIDPDYKTLMRGLILHRFMEIFH